MKGGLQSAPPCDGFRLAESKVSTPEATSEGAVIALLFQVARWLPTGVASQNSGPVAGAMPSFARQHTFRPGKEPENKGLAAWTPAGLCGSLGKPAARPLPARSSPENIAEIANCRAVCLALRYLTEKCLTRDQGLTARP